MNSIVCPICISNISSVKFLFSFKVILFLIFSINDNDEILCSFEKLIIWQREIIVSNNWYILSVISIAIIFSSGSSRNLRIEFAADLFKRSAWSIIYIFLFERILFSLNSFSFTNEQKDVKIVKQNDHGWVWSWDYELVVGGNKGCFQLKSGFENQSTEQRKR